MVSRPRRKPLPIPGRPSDTMQEEVTLRRALTRAQVTYYGLGTILGAGIYVLVGKVAGYAGLYAPVAFFVAGLIALFTALSYAELAARYPQSGGEAIYVREGLRWRPLAMTVGALITLGGTVSCATLIDGFVGYLGVFVHLPRAMAILLVVAGLWGLASWGIRESVRAASLVTIIEIGGLLLIILVSGASLATLPARWQELLPPFDASAWKGIMLGAFIAFYAFLGFEDIVNVAEEVEQPTTNLPHAILLALGISTLLYLLVALAAVLSLPRAELAQSPAPLAAMYVHATGKAPVLISVVSLFAVINGALIQIIMSARVLYGMSRRGWLPRRLGHVSRRTRTPVFATATVSLASLALALWLPLVTLAKATSFLILVVFTLVNLSLIRVKRRAPKPEGVKCYPLWVPGVGLASTLALVIFQIIMWLTGR
jgi:APA family basic amino acid/polyamine antiporter